MCIFQKAKTMTDEEILKKMYALQMRISDEYNQAIDQCKDAALYETLLNILHDAHTMTKSIETELAKRGCIEYQTADQTDVQIVKNRFSSMQYKY